MRIGVPAETKNHEYRAGLLPAGVRTLVAAGHEVVVQAGAAVRIGYPDDAFLAAGARICPDARGAYACDLVVKVKELQRAEFALARAGQILFCYHHFAPDRGLLDAMTGSGATCIAYETVTDADGGLPLLVPMSQIAGRLAPQAGAWALQMANGGSGVLPGGVPGVAPAKVLVVGGGTVGTHAARIALGMGADVTLADRSAPRLARLEEIFGSRLKTAASSAATLPELVHDADLVIGAVLVPGQLAPKLVRREDLGKMRAGSVIVDVAIDQGGICETSHPTSHSDPIYTGKRRRSLLRAEHAVRSGAHGDAGAHAGDAALCARAGPQGAARRNRRRRRPALGNAGPRGPGHARRACAGYGARFHRSPGSHGMTRAYRLGVPVADIDALLPQTQCRQCGHHGCRPYAEAIAAGQARINQCPPGGDDLARELATLLGVEYEPLDASYGIHKRPSVAIIDEQACIGCTLCIKACPVDAIIGARRLMHAVLAVECTGCELCLPPCPVDCIRMQETGAAPTREQKRAAAVKARRRYEARTSRLQREHEQRAARIAARSESAAARRKRETVARAVRRARERLGRPAR
jgi:alanine dehydrogenase